MMEHVQEQKFVCKFCNKCCFSGKSLGGHMRCHLALISAAKKEKVKADIKMGFGDGDDDDDYWLEENSMNSCRVSAEQSNSSLIQVKVENQSSMNLRSDDQDQDSYGLRENPKKSWKASDLKACRAPRRGNLCKECGRRFPSSRALAGHMRTHSEKFKDQHICKKCGKGFDSMRAMFGHMKSHPKRSRVSSESADGLSDFDIVYPKKKRSIIRYKFSQNFSFSIHNVSSSVKEFEEEENAAMCLMMLSRGVTNWDRYNCPLDCTDNATSVDFEAKSFPYHKGMANIDGDDFLYNHPDEVCKTEKPTEDLDSWFSGSGNCISRQNVSEVNDLGSEFANGDENKAELEVCVDEHLCSGESKKSRHVDVSDVELDETKIKRAIDSAEVELLNDQNKVVDKDQKDLQLLDPNPCKKLKLNAHDPELVRNSSDVAKYDDTVVEIFKEFEKKREYKCRICNTIFSSHQALGGHSNRHKILGGCSGSSTEINHLSGIECNDTSTETVSGGVVMEDFEITKSKDHECPICLKVFPTGQALGGHKRAHYVGFSESRIKETTVVSQELKDVQNIIDLNLSLMVHEGLRDGDVGLKVWWVGSGHEPESLVISN